MILCVRLVIGIFLIIRVGSGFVCGSLIILLIISPSDIFAILKNLFVAVLAQS
jgi:hypothetical protein